MASAQHRCGIQAGDLDSRFATLDKGCLSEHPAPKCVHRERSGAETSGVSLVPAPRVAPGPALGRDPPPAFPPRSTPTAPRPSSFLPASPSSAPLEARTSPRSRLPLSILSRPSGTLGLSPLRLWASPSLCQSLSPCLSLLSVCLFLGLTALSVRQSVWGPAEAAGRARVAMSGVCTSYVSAEQEVVRGFGCPRPGGDAAAVFCCGFRDHKYCCDDPHSFFPYEHSYMWWLRYRPWPSPHLEPRSRPSPLAPSSAQPRAKPAVLIQVRTRVSAPTPTPPLPPQALTNPDLPCSRFSAPSPHFNSNVIRSHP